MVESRENLVFKKVCIDYFCLCEKKKKDVCVIIYVYVYVYVYYILEC